MNSNVVLLIDWENIKKSTIKHLNIPPDVIILKKIARRYGEIVIAKAYANWSDSQHEGDMNRFSYQDIEPVFVQTRKYGPEKPGGEEVVKGSVDIKIACDAVEMLFNFKDLQTFVIASGDGGFEHIFSKLRAYGKVVVPIGIRKSTSGRIGLLSEFQYYDDWILALKSFKNLENLELERALRRFQNTVEDVRIEKINNSLQSIKSVMQKQDLNFEEEKIGFPSFRHLAYMAEARQMVRIDSYVEPAKAYKFSEKTSDEGMDLYSPAKWDALINTVGANVPYNKKTLATLIKDRKIFDEETVCYKFVDDAKSSGILWVNDSHYHNPQADKIIRTGEYFLNMSHPRVQVYRTIKMESASNV